VPESLQAVDLFFLRVLTPWQKPLTRYADELDQPRAWIQHPPPLGRSTL